MSAPNNTHTDIVRFVKKVALFLSILASVVLLLDMFFYKFIAPITILQGTDEQFQQHKNDTEILFLGDSHVQYAIDPLQIPHSFNFSSAGESYIKTYYKLKTIIPDKDFVPEVVVLQLDMHSFSSRNSEILENEWYWKKYISPWEASTVIKDFSVSRMIVRSNIPIIGHGGYFLFYLRGLIKKDEMATLIRGHQVADDFYQDDKDKQVDAIIAVDNEHFRSGVVLDALIMEFFTKTLDFLRSHDVATVLIKYPVTELYYTTASRHFQSLADHYGTLEKVIRERKNVLCTLDYQKMYFDNASFFVDGNHLKHAGATEFSKLVNEDIRECQRQTNNGSKALGKGRLQ